MLLRGLSCLTPLHGDDGDGDGDHRNDDADRYPYPSLALITPIGCAIACFGVR
jgi:hypothetical protein